MRYILTHWVHKDGYEARHLRPVTRENKRYFISDVQRTTQSYDKEPYKKVFVYKWATKFYKDNSELGFRRSVTRLCNTDGVMNLNWVDPADTFCVKNFDELFTKNNIKVYSNGTEEDKNRPFMNWDAVLIKYLMQLFKVNEISHISGIYDYEEKDHEGNPLKRVELEKYGTLFHVNTFGGVDKKYISQQDNYFNRTIMYWLFKDKLVFFYDSGKETW